MAAFGGVGGGMGGPLSPAGRMAPPEMTERPAPGNVDSRTLISSPLADRIGGPLMEQQEMAKEAQMLHKMAVPVILQIARRRQERDPKSSAKLYKIAGDLVQAVPPVQPPPTSLGGMSRMTGGMPPMPGGAPGGSGAPPAPVPGTGSTLSGPLAGM